ncbi:MAG TPA: hypothetical protein VKV06_11615 [Acidimicrobiales bacterium]|nr:hypothetical protein [Acidimicrobiales bacterium]
MAIESAAADEATDEGGLDHADHDHPYAHEAVSLCAEHAGAEHADAWTQLHRG